MRNCYKKRLSDFMFNFQNMCPKVGHLPEKIPKSDYKIWRLALLLLLFFFYYGLHPPILKSFLGPQVGQSFKT